MITITVPDNASLEDVLKHFVLEVLRIHQCEVGAAKRLVIGRDKIRRWLDEWGIILAYVQDSPNVIPARKRKKPRAARSIPRSASPSKPDVKGGGLQSIADEAAAIRAAHERRRAPGGAP